MNRSQWLNMLQRVLERIPFKKFMSYISFLHSDITVCNLCLKESGRCILLWASLVKFNTVYNSSEQTSSLQSPWGSVGFAEPYRPSLNLLRCLCRSLVKCKSLCILICVHCSCQRCTIAEYVHLFVILEWRIIAFLSFQQCPNVTNISVT
jgi:hypothetical protein